MTIAIQPYTLGSAAAPRVATQFEVRHITYTAPTAVADCHLRTAAGVEILAIGLVAATEAQCAAWDDDAAFAAVLATNAGFIPL